MSLSRKKCCVPGCLESGSSHGTLHLFPNPAKDINRFNQWISAIGGDIIGCDNEHIYKHRSVCHGHFEEKYCCRYNRLSNIAVPTLSLPGPLFLANMSSSERRPMRQIQNIPETSSSSAIAEGLPSTTSKDACETSTYSAELLSTQSPTPQPTPINSTACRKPVTKTVKMKISPAEQNLRLQITKMQIKLSKYKNKVKKQSASIKAASKITSNPALLATIEKMPTNAKMITLMQFRELKKKTKGRRFSLQEKIIALSMFKQTPKGYRFLRKYFILPAPQTLAKLINQADIKPGINKKIFAQLKNVSEKMKNEEKLCILLFDEMHLNANISYNERKDAATGFVTDGRETKQEFADHAQVYMIRGLMKNYKQAIAYSFSAKATSGAQIAKQVKEVIGELQEAGLVVVATVCDQGANNRNAIKLMIQETRGQYLRAGQEPKENVILINEQEVVPLYDPPHLIKCVRNNLLTKDLVYYSENDSNKKCTAKWQHLILLHKENPGYKGIRIIPKLTENHVLPEKISRNKMKVKFASQIFSRTVATNMGYLADKNIIPQECSETADILIFFDNLFDSQNGSYNKKNEKFAKPLLGPVTPKSIHKKEWAQAKKKLRCMKFVNPITQKAENVPTLDNWAWTLDGTEVLIQKMEKEYNITSVWMRHLNQDPIENFFGAIRSHGCRNTNPTAENFESAFITLLINNMSSVHAPAGANCEIDLCESLHAFIVTDDCKATTTCDLDLIEEIVIENLNEKNDPRILAGLQYVTGYFARNARRKIFKNCKHCTKNVIATEALEYIQYREFAGRQWLCSPTENLLKCMSAVQDITFKLLQQCIHKNYVKELIKTHIIMFTEFDFLDCEEHKDKLIEYLINLSCRFYIYNYCKEVNKILHGKLDCREDDEDILKLKAKKYFMKCSKRPRNK